MIQFCEGVSLRPRRTLPCSDEDLSVGEKCGRVVAVDEVENSRQAEGPRCEIVDLCAQLTTAPADTGPADDQHFAVQQACRGRSRWVVTERVANQTERFSSGIIQLCQFTEPPNDQNSSVRE